MRQKHDYAARQTSPYLLRRLPDATRLKERTAEVARADDCSLFGEASDVIGVAVVERIQKVAGRRAETSTRFKHKRHKILLGAALLYYTHCGLQCPLETAALTSLTIHEYAGRMANQLVATLGAMRS